MGGGGARGSHGAQGELLSCPQHAQKMSVEEEQSLTQLGVISILMRFLNGFLFPFWWVVVKCFKKFCSILQQVHPHPKGK